MSSVMIRIGYSNYWLRGNTEFAGMWGMQHFIHTAHEALLLGWKGGSIMCAALEAALMQAANSRVDALTIK